MLSQSFKFIFVSILLTKVLLSPRSFAKPFQFLDNLELDSSFRIFRRIRFTLQSVNNLKFYALNKSIEYHLDR